jgi:DME family drug/metabolite transporter
VLVVLGAATWGTTGTAQAVAATGASPLLVGAARTVGGAATLAVLLTALPRLRVAGGARGWLLLAGAAVATYQLLFFAGVEATRVAVGTVVGIGSVPVLTGALSWLLDRNRPTRGWFVATGLAVLGTVLVLGSSTPDSEVDARGVGLAVGAGLAYAVLTIAARRLLDAGWGPLAAMGAVFAIGSLPSAAVLLLGEVDPLLTGPGIALVSWLALVTVAVGYALYACGLRVLAPATVGTLTLTEPLVAAVLGVVLLAERPGLTAVAGAGLIAVGLVLTARAPAPTAHDPASNG